MLTKKKPLHLPPQLITYFNIKNYIYSVHLGFGGENKEQWVWRTCLSVHLDLYACVFACPVTCARVHAYVCDHSVECTCMCVAQSSPEVCSGQRISGQVSCTSQLAMASCCGEGQESEFALGPAKCRMLFLVVSAELSH